MNKTSLNMETINKNIAKERLQSILGLVIFVLLILWASAILNFDYMQSLEAIPQTFRWISQNFYPTREALQDLPRILEKLLETILMSIAATTLAAFFAYIMAIFISDTTKVNNVLAGLMRFISTVFRDIPHVVWSMLFLFSFGQNALTGFLAIFFVSTGTLTRNFADTIDASSIQSVEALQAVGADRMQIIGQAILPQSLPGVISWVLYQVEDNIRSSTLIGILTGSGIGHTFNLYYQTFNYDSAALVVIAIILVVLVIQWISSTVRRALI